MKSILILCFVGISSVALGNSMLFDLYQDLSDSRQAEGRNFSPLPGLTRSLAKGWQKSSGGESIDDVLVRLADSCNKDGEDIDACLDGYEREMDSMMHRPSYMSNYLQRGLNEIQRALNNAQ
jgi:hypothetical protein